MSLGDFVWLAEEVWNDLAQDPLGHSQPLSFEAQVVHPQGDCRQSVGPLCQCSFKGIPLLSSQRIGVKSWPIFRGAKGSRGLCYQRHPHSYSNASQQQLEILSLQKKHDQLHAVDMQHAPAKLPFKLHIFAYVESLAQ
ncbi:hypothetical protein VP01_2631g1 [Puccinia sorghi]|uniref:Uncharacterized protein n=1 Tax=Puccinia sorghi TaxID=27349 RepID=A0A0L6V4A4_9BASI|nr:hypothetical protein VP01_2631g1 [Puccinia sorghi]